MGTDFVSTSRRAACLSALSLSLLAAVGPVWAQAVGQTAQTPDAALQQALAERDRLWDQIQQLDKDGKPAEALDKARQAVSIEQEALGPEHSDVAYSWIYIAMQLERLERFDEAIEARQTVLAIRSKLYGVDDWRVTDARLAFDQATLLKKLSPADRQELRKAEQLYQQGKAMYRQGTYGGVLPLALEISEIRKRILGTEHPDYARSLNTLAVLYYSMGDHAHAEPLFQQAVEIDKRVFGEKHPSYAHDLNDLAMLYHRKGDYARAEPRYRQVSEIYKAAYGENHSSYATSLNNLAGLYGQLGDYARAEPLFQQALKIDKVALGEKHPDYATELNNLAELYQRMGDYAQAEQLHRQALEIRKAALGENHPDYAASLHNLAVLYYIMGDYARAEPLYRQAADVQRTILGEHHPQYAASLSGLALLYMSMGDYAQAEPIFRQALKIEKDTLGEKHPDYAAYLTNFALLYDNMGDYARAEPLYRQALEIRKSVLGDHHPSVAKSLNNLAELYRKMGKYAQAEPLFRQALTINKVALGEKHPDYALALHNLALLCGDMGDYAQAESFCKQALEIDKMTLGEHHPNYALDLNNLGGLYREMGDYQKAEPLCRQAVEIYKTGLDQQNPHCISSLNNLSAVKAAQGDWPAAWLLVNEAMTMREMDLQRVFSISSERQMQARLASVSGDFDALLSFPATDDSSTAVAYAWNLRRKAIVFETLCRYRAAQDLLTNNPNVQAKANQFRAKQLQLNNLKMRPPAGQSAETLDDQQKVLRNEIEDLQSEVNRLLAENQGTQTEGQITLDLVLKTVEDVRDKLPARAALVELVKYDPLDFVAKGKERRWGEPRYVAFVLNAGPAKPVARIELGDAAQIDKRVEEFSQQMDDAKQAYQAGFRMASEADLEQSFRQASARLSSKLFAPLVEALGDAKQIYLSPDSQLHSVPFEALVDAEGPDGKYLIEQGYRFAYLSSGRDLLRPEHKPGEGTYVFAGPNFDLEHADHYTLAKALRVGSPGTDEYKSPPVTAVAVLDRSVTRSTRSLDLRGSTWTKLDGAEQEGQEAVDQFNNSPFGPARFYQGNQALEEAFTQLSRPRLLVVITHGFFAADQPQEMSDDDLLFGGTEETRGGFAAAVIMERLRASENPLLRSGLVLAGANAADEPLPEGMEGRGLADGWLTAEEISQLDLRGTELVVLSACESNRGQVATGEAVAGLRSAFMFAGAETLVGSLYEVPDEETRQLMHDFYAGLCAGKGKLASLNTAQRAMLDRRRKAGGAAHPFFWSSFVLVGEP